MHLRTRPTFSVVTSCASSSSRMCFFIPVSDMPKGSASSLIVALPLPSRSSTARRVGAARAEKGRSTVAGCWTIRFSIAGLARGMQMTFGRRDSLRDVGRPLVLLVGHVLAPGHEATALVRLLDRDVCHEPRRRGTVPVLLARLEEDAVARADDLDRP